MPLSPTTPDLTALDLFVSVVELGSVSKAAAAHQIAQPSASSRVRYLEKQLGISLLERSPSGSVPTAAGSLVAGWAEATIRSAHELNAGVDALKARRAGRLRVVASLTIAEYLLPSWLEKFLRNRPDDSIKLEVANSSVVLERLSAHDADLGFIESPVPTPNMGSKVIGVDRLIAVVSPVHPWTRRKSVAVEELSSTPLVVRERGSGTREALELELSRLGFEAPNSALELGSTSAVRSAVVSGTSPTVISERAVSADLAAGSLVEIAIDGLRVDRELRAVWPKTRPLPQLADELLKAAPAT